MVPGGELNPQGPKPAGKALPVASKNVFRFGQGDVERASHDKRLRHEGNGPA
jgi:hypothetical protein